MLEDVPLPAWSRRVRDERVKRLWSQKMMAVKLRQAADGSVRASLPSVDSVQRYVRAYEAGRHIPGDLYKELYCRAFGLTRDSLFGGLPGAAGVDPGYFMTRGYAKGLAGWVKITNVSDDAVDVLAQAAHELAEVHTSRPPSVLLSDVTHVHVQVQDILRSGRQRLAQTRELLRVDTELLAHASLLLGDLHRDGAAVGLGGAALVYADEAGTNKAMPFSVLAKTERWRQRLSKSAELAHRGFEVSPPTSIRILLASQEAHASALLGDMRRAYDALHRAEQARAVQTGADSGISAWSFTRPRQALFAAAVAIRAGDAGGVVRFVADADAAWADGEPMVTATWAQVRLVAAIGHLMHGDIESANAEFVSVQSLSPEFRMATITGYTSQMTARLRQRRFANDRAALELIAQINEFESAANVAIATEAK